MSDIQEKKSDKESEKNDLANPENQDNLDTNKPALSIDPQGNLILFLPLAKTNDITCRGMIDKAHDEMVMWYVRASQKRAEIAMLAQKTGFQRFKDQLLRR